MPSLGFKLGSLLQMQGFVEVSRCVRPQPNGIDFPTTRKGALAA